MPLLPTNRPLDEQTAELTILLGSTDPAERENLAYRTLARWIGEGVYDDLLAGLGDGLAVGLEVGLGESGTDSVFRRSWSARLLADCVRRDTRERLLPARQALVWGDRISTWLVRERDLRGHVQGKGRAHAVAHGADALAALAGSPDFGAPELTVLLDVIADRLMLQTSTRLVDGEPDRLARACMAVLLRDAVPLTVLEPWVARLANGALAGDPAGALAVRSWNAQTFLRSLHLQVSLGPSRPAVRSDLALVLAEALRETNPDLRPDLPAPRRR